MSEGKKELVRVFGPPGTGKTTWIEESVASLINESRVSGDDIALMSFSRSAFGNLKNRVGDSINSDNIGTIHSLAYRLIGSPELAVTPAKLREWREFTRPAWHHNGGNLDIYDPEGKKEYAGDALYREICYLRNTLTPLKEWPLDAYLMWEAWRDWMTANELIDYPGMLERALVLPRSLNIPYLLIDEAQDLSALQMQLVLSWTHYSRYTALVGDDDQSIYSFMSADSSGFLRPEATKELVLPQSYRVPRQVQNVALDVINRVQDRVTKQYRPRKLEGYAKRISDRPEALSVTLKMIQDQLQSGETVMIIAQAEYMIKPIATQLLQHQIPYHNPYAPSRPEFNIFMSNSPDNLFRTHFYPTNYDYIKSWLRADKTVWDIKVISQLLRPGLLNAEYTSNPELAYYGIDDTAFIASQPQLLDTIFTKDGVEGIKSGSFGWLRRNMENALVRRLEPILGLATLYPSYNPQDLPKAILGTIHSVKGGEADHVYLLPGYTPRAARDGLDALHRLYYVALTRARVGVNILCPSRNTTPYYLGVG